MWASRARCTRIIGSTIPGGEAAVGVGDLPGHRAAHRVRERRIEPEHRLTISGGKAPRPCRAAARARRSGRLAATMGSPARTAGSAICWYHAHAGQDFFSHPTAAPRPEASAGLPARKACTAGASSAVEHLERQRGLPSRLQQRREDPACSRWWSGLSCFSPSITKRRLRQPCHEGGLVDRLTGLHVPDHAHQRVVGAELGLPRSRRLGRLGRARPGQRQGPPKPHQRPSCAVLPAPRRPPAGRRNGSR